MITYSLTKNTMNPDANECIAIVSQTEKTDLDQILDYMVMEGTGLTRPQALAYFEKLTQAVEYFVETKGGLTTPLFRIRTTISGVFLNKADKFDPARHQVHIRITPGNRLSQLEARMKVKKELHSKQTPHPTTLIDPITQSWNKQVSPGSIATLRGHDLKFDSQDPMQGIFFISENNPATQIRVSVYSGIGHSKVHFLIPPLQAGTYKIVVKAIMKNHTSIREGQLFSLITVS